MNYSFRRWRAIGFAGAAANHIAKPELIFPGQQLVIPALPGPPDPTPTPGPLPGSRLVAVTDDAHIIVRFGVQNLLEEKTQTKPPVTPPPIARARAANDSRVVFELPAGDTTGDQASATSKDGASAGKADSDGGQSNS